MDTKIFIHGLESSSQGVKGKYFREKFPDMIIPDFTGSLENRMKKLRTLLKGKSNIKIIGSSYGGLMATIFAMEEPMVSQMILLAPAINYISMAVEDIKKIHIPVWIYHGIDDNIIPLNEVKQVARDIFTNLYFNIVNDNHYLHNTLKVIPWIKLLS